ncbi:MAG: hypothetical protein WD872_16080 [Pirellulaceae bacterium]
MTPANASYGFGTFRPLACLDWIDQHQLGKRNVTDAERALCRGRLYNRRKKAHGGTGANQHKEQSCQNDNSANRTAQIVAKELGVSPATIKRDKSKDQNEPLISTAEVVAKELGVSAAAGGRSDRQFSGDQNEHPKTAELSAAEQAVGRGVRQDRFQGGTGPSYQRLNRPSGAALR